MGQGKIVLVEDNPDHEFFISRSLRAKNVVREVVVVRDGAQAVDYFFGRDGKGQPGFSHLPDLVLLDIKLPKVDGIEVLRRLRAGVRTRFLPVVMLTSSDEEKDLLAAYNLGANSFIRKPIDYYDFSEAIQKSCSYWLRYNETPY